MSRKRQQKAGKSGRKATVPAGRQGHRSQSRPNSSAASLQAQEAQTNKVRVFVEHLAALPRETKMAMAVVLLIFVVSRAVIVVMAMLGEDPNFLAAVGLEPGDFGQFTEPHFGTGKDWVSALCKYDCHWYQRIMTGGYDVAPFLEPWWEVGKAPWAFFPLFPVSAGIIARVLSLPPLEAAYLFNGPCTIAAAWLLYLMVRDHHGHPAGLIAASLFLTSPFSLHLSLSYTEALFNLLSVTAFYMAYQKRWLASGLAMALLSATRPTGLLVAFAILVIAIAQVGLPQLLRAHAHARITLAFALCPLGLGLFALYLYVLHGDALAFSNVQVSWHAELKIPFVAIFNGLFETAGHFPWVVKYNAIVAVLGLCMAALLARFGRWPEAVFLAAVVLVSSMGVMRSLPRYVLGIWPAYYLFAILLRNRPIIPLVLPFLLVVGLGIFAMSWVNAVQWLV